MVGFYEILQKLTLPGEEKRRLAWIYETAEQAERRLLEHHVWAEHEKQFGVLPFEEGVMLPAPTSREAEGKYRWAAVKESVGGSPKCVFGIEPGELLQHAVIVGRSGAGKTNTLISLVRGMLSSSERPAIWVFDWKRSWRELLARDAKSGFLVFTLGRSTSPLSFNPLVPPPRVELDVWVNLLIDIFGHAYFEGHGATSMLQRGLEGAYGLHEAQSGKGPATWPTLSDVKSCLDGIKTSQRESLWLTSLNRALQRLTYGSFGKALNARNPIAMEELLRRDIVLEMGALSDPDRAFLCGALLLWIYQYMLQREETREKLNLLLVFEESHFLFSKDKEKTGETIIERLPRMVRELGVGLVLADQQPHLLSTQALANTYCKVAMNLAHEYDLRAIGAAMGLDSELKKGLGHLPVGFGVVKLQDRYTHPFLVRFPLVPLHKGTVTEAMIAERMKGFGETAPRSAGPVAGSNHHAEPARDSKTDGKKKRRENRSAGIVADMFGHPLSSHSERWQRLSMTPYEGSRSCRALVKQGLVRVVEIPTQTGRVKIAFPTKTCMERRWPADRRLKRRGGTEHACWAWLVQRRFEEEGFTFELNVPLGKGKEADAVARRGHEKVAVEIETMSSGLSAVQAVANAQKCLDYGFDRVVILTVRHCERVTRGLQVAGLDGDTRIEVWDPRLFFSQWWQATREKADAT